MDPITDEPVGPTQYYYKRDGGWLMVTYDGDPETDSVCVVLHRGHTTLHNANMFGGPEQRILLGLGFVSDLHDSE